MLTIVLKVEAVALSAGPKNPPSEYIYEHKDALTVSGRWFVTPSETRYVTGRRRPSTSPKVPSIGHGTHNKT
jgi:hypothetical protein